MTNLIILVISGGSFGSGCPVRPVRVPWVPWVSGAGRRTSLRFYSNSGDLFHAVEVPMSRGPKTWQTQEKWDDLERPKNMARQSIADVHWPCHHVMSILLQFQPRRCLEHLEASWSCIVLVGTPWVSVGTMGKAAELPGAFHSHLHLAAAAPHLPMYLTGPREFLVFQVPLPSRALSC